MVGSEDFDISEKKKEEREREEIDETKTTESSLCVFGQ